MFKKNDKKEINYYDIFVEMLDCSLEAATRLYELMCDYNDVARKADEIHSIEHRADTLLHDMMIELNRAFITPIDREDIMSLADKIDSITDCIEDVSNLFDMCSVKAMRAETPLLGEMIVKACKTLREAAVQFKSFKSSKTFKDEVIEVNHLEEEGDRLHRALVKQLYIEETSPVEIIKWLDIYNTMESVLDLCEDTADLLDSVSVKNS